MLRDDNSLDLLTANLHSQADLREGSVPVGWQLSFVNVKPSPSSWKIENSPVAPKVGGVVKGSLDMSRKEEITSILTENGRIKIKLQVFDSNDTLNTELCLYLWTMDLHDQRPSTSSACSKPSAGHVTVDRNGLGTQAQRVGFVSSRPGETQFPSSAVLIKPFNIQYVEYWKLELFRYFAIFIDQFLAR